MEKEKHSPLSRFEYDGSFRETKLSKKIEQNTNNPSTANKTSSGTILFPTKPTKRKKSFKWIRIRSFFIKHKKFKRMMEFSCHPSGIHMLKLAVFYSDSGCGMCKVYVEKNLY